MLPTCPQNWKPLMPEMRFEATVNGRKVARNVKPHQRLLDVLRDDLGFTGTKEGCGAGECGTCSVFVDGVLVKSCLLPAAKAQGADVETIELLAKGGELSVLQKAFYKAGASQCGYCIPGMVMAATAALRTNPLAGREEIKERLGGNICRCTGYQKIIDAVELARDVQLGRAPASVLAEDDVGDGRFIGANVRRIDAPSKVTGRLRYAGDMVMPGMLHLQVLRSPHPHAASSPSTHPLRNPCPASRASSPAPMCLVRTVSVYSSAISRLWRAAKCVMSARPSLP